MDAERKRRIEALFEEALEHPPEQRPGWISRACAHDRLLRAEVLALLAAHERMDGILERPAPVDPVLDTTFADRRLGPYRLVERIGRGGMGSVYRAERDDDQFRHRVAIKLIRRGLDTDDLLSRFRAERQILATLQHPNIARLLDGGVAADGRPYLVMEYVEGEPLDLYCDRNRLTLEQRLRLFCVVARAVHHAHRNLVVHRDLKPSNVLVTPQGEIKLLDFGIAKLLDPTAVALPVPMTRTELRLMTPEYAAPEQVRGQPVTTATDVYGLGVVLYELLCGHRPYRLAGLGVGEVERVVCEQDPARPSSRVMRVEEVDLGEEVRRIGPAEVARGRGTTPDRLRRRLSGDLDRIVAKALRKEPERRYQSAEAVAEEIDRYLEGRPVVARGESAVYRLGKFVQRNRWPVVVAAAFVLVLGGYAATVTVKERQVREALEQARIEAEKADHVTAFIMRLFEADDPISMLTDSVSARDLLERGLQQVQQLRGQPAAQAQMLDVVGRVYQYLGEYDLAMPLMERALELRTQAFGPDHPTTAESLYDLADVHYDLGEWDEAEPLYRRSLEIQRARLGAATPEVARSLTGLGMVLRDRGDLAAAEPLAREALSLRRRLFGEAHPDVAESMNQLAALLRRMGRYDQAEPLYREALAQRRRLFGAEHPAVAESLNDLALQLYQKGDLDGAEPLYREAADLYARLLGPDHPFLATVHQNLGRVLLDRGEIEEADSLFRRALAVRRTRLGELNPHYLRSLSSIATVHRLRGELDEAEGIERQVYESRVRVLGAGHRDVGRSLAALADIARDRGRLDEAEPLYRQALAIRRASLGDAHPEVAASRARLASLLDERGFCCSPGQEGRDRGR